MNVLMPQLGETVAEGTISRWYKQAGDRIAAGDVLFEIETDKTSMDVPAIVPGVLTDVLAAAGSTVPVGSVVATITEEGAVAASAPSSAKSEPSPLKSDLTPAKVAVPAASSQSQPQPTKQAPAAPIDPFHGLRTPERNYGPATLKSGIKVTPLARRLALQGGIDLERVVASGPKGRIVAADVRQAAQKSVQQPSAATVVANRATGQEIQLDAMRRTIAQRLVESKPGIPHFYLKSHVAVDALLALRKELNAVSGQKISVNDLVVKAYALALQKVPNANRIWMSDKLLQFDRSDVGIAVSTPGGLITPVVRSADTKRISELATEIRDLAERGKAKKLKPDEYQGGAATVSNLGMFGIPEFLAIINPPQSTILAVGATERRAEEGEGGAIRFATKMTVTLSVDHRVLDGAVAAELLGAFRELVERPVSLLI